MVLIHVNAMQGGGSLLLNDSFLTMSFLSVNTSTARLGGAASCYNTNGSIHDVTLNSNSAVQVREHCTGPNRMASMIAACTLCRTQHMGKVPVNIRHCSTMMRSLLPGDGCNLSVIAPVETGVGHPKTHNMGNPGVHQTILMHVP